MSDTQNRYLNARKVNPRKPRNMYYSSNPTRDTQGVKNYSGPLKRASGVANTGNLTQPATRERVQVYVRKYGGNAADFGLKKAPGEVLEQGARPLLKTFIKGYGAGLLSTALFTADTVDLAGMMLGIPGTMPQTGQNGLVNYPLGGGQWTKLGGDYFYGPPYVPMTQDNLYASASYYYPWNQPWNSPAISGQAIGVVGKAHETVIYNNPQFYWQEVGYWWKHDTIDRYAQYACFIRTDWYGGTPVNTNIKVRDPALEPADPNRLREQPLVPARDPAQTARENAARLRANMETNPEGDWIAREYIFNAPPQTSTAPKAGSRLAPRPPRTDEAALVLPPPVLPSAKQPPGPGTKEAKAISRSAQIGIALFRNLDRISESAEVVDALYRALPIEVQKETACGKKKSRGYVDQAGQYGIDHADCKLKALYDNWHQLDAAQAIKNILANEIEDRLYGKAYQAKDKVTGRGRYRRKGTSQRRFYQERVSAKTKQQRRFQRVSQGQ